MESSGADWTEASELELEEMLSGCKDDVSSFENKLFRLMMIDEFGNYPPELKVHDELMKKRKRDLKKIVDDVIRKADKPLSRGEVLWRLLLLDFDVGCASSRNEISLHLEKLSTSSTSQIKPQLDLKSLLSAINEQIAEASSTQQSGKEKRNAVLQNVSEDFLLPMKCMLEKELEEWNDWAGQKVMQAAERLSKCKEELRLLRLQKQTCQFMEELTRQQFFLKAGNLFLARGLSGKAHVMETLNDQLRMELKDAQLHAAEVEENCKNASRRLEETLQKLKSAKEEKLLLLDELAAEKHHFDQLQRQFEQAKDLHDNMKSEWQKEEKLKNEALEMAKAERKEREQIEMAANLEENALKIEAENNLQRYKNEIRQLQNKIAELKLSLTSSNICVPRWEAEGSSASNLSEEHLAKIFDADEESENELKRAWECVMCLSELASVVLLPCAHQVFCRQCNELHEQKGAKECPSCRTPIQRRIFVRSADDP